MKAHPFFKTSLLFSLMLVLAGFVQAQTVERDLATFDEITAFGNVEVVLIQGENPSVKIKAVNISPEKIITEVTGGRLSVRLQNAIYKKDEYARITVTAPLFREVKAQAGARIESRGQLEGDRIVLTAIAGGLIEAEVATNDIDAKAGEGGKIYLSGETKTFHGVASNGGELDSYGLQAQDVYAKANVGGIARVYAAEKLEASAKAGGRVVFAGDPSQQSFSTALGGAIVPRGEGD